MLFSPGKIPNSFSNVEIPFEDFPGPTNQTESRNGQRFAPRQGTNLAGSLI